MPWVYFDASALIKRYTQEKGTSLVNEAFRLLGPSHMACSIISILEIVFALVRKRNDGRLDQALFEQAMIEFRNEVIDQEEFVTTSVNDSLLFSALDLIAKYSLNATDAVILRSALILRQALTEDLTLWASDRRLGRAAQDEGLVVFDPEGETMDRLHQLLGTEHA